MAKRAHREIIEDICDGCDKDCTLKGIILHSGFDDRTLEQIKCIEFLKFEKDIPWKEAFHLWTSKETGYAEKFSKIYEEHGESLRARGIYNMVIGKNPLG